MAYRYYLLVCLLFFISLAQAKPLSLTPGYWGGSMAVRAKSVTNMADPTDIRGMRLALAYHPQDGIHKRLHVFLDGAYAIYQTNRDPHYDQIQIISFATVARFYLWENPYLSPYLEGSIGPAYMNATQFGKQYMGIRYTFQDRAALGVSFGPKKQASLALLAVHYSNADISKYNDGMTAPLMLEFNFIFN